MGTGAIRNERNNINNLMECPMSLREEKEINNIKDIKENDKNDKIDKKNDFIKRTLEKHNELRKKHGSNNLRISQELNQMAQEQANKLTEHKREFFNHLYKDEVLGENILISDDLSIKPEKICEEWYNEGINYDYKLNKFQKGKGHFTQLIWKDSKEVGFGFNFTNNEFIAVAYYYPSGNIIGKFSDNVKEKK